MSDQQLVQQWIVYASKLAQQGRCDEAMQALQRVVEELPQNLPVRSALIEVALQKKDYQTVVSQHMECAELLMLAGDPKAAIEQYKQIISLEGLGGAEEAAPLPLLIGQLKPEIYRRAGEARLQLGHLEVAVHYLEVAQELAPGVWQTHLALGRAYLATQSYKAAIGELQEVLRLTQSGEQAAQAQAYQLIGEVFVAQGRPAVATITWFERAAQLWLQADRPQEAGQAYQRIADLDPTNKAAQPEVGETPPPPDLQLRSQFSEEEPQVIRISKRRDL